MLDVLEMEGLMLDVLEMEGGTIPSSQKDSK